MRRIAVRSVSIAALTLLAAAPAFAERASDQIPISNWTAPPYWMPAGPHRGSESRSPEAVAVANPSLAFHATPPCRIADTRGFGFTGPYGPPSLNAGAVRSFAVTSPGTTCGIPSGVAAVSFNFAATSLTANGNLVAYPMGGAPPSVSSLNWTPSEVAISNAAVIALASDSISIVVNGPSGSTADLIIDVNGYYAADPVVTSVNTMSGAVIIQPAADVTVTSGGGLVTIGVDAGSANTPNTIVRRGAQGEFAAGELTVTDLDLGGSGRILRGANLYFHSTGSATNTFVGLHAGNPSVASTFNTSLGEFALHALTGGTQNVAVGSHAGENLTNGSFDIAIGTSALTANAGDDDIAIGNFACENCTGNSNVAIGSGTLGNETTGHDNIALGYHAGVSLFTGSNNIFVGNNGASESNTIRIGSGQSATYLAGVSGSTAASGVPVLVNGNDKLGTTTSSARFKEDVHDVGDESDGLLKLRPVAFRYRPELDPEGIEQFGLIAEEVEKVYPGLVTCGEDGQPQAVRYHFLVPMLLNQVQKDRKQLADFQARLERLESLLAQKSR
jgi:hypothetical protein